MVSPQPEGARRLGGPPFPLLWERDPDLDGRMLVGRSDGMVAVWDPETLFRAVAELPSAERVVLTRDSLFP